MAAFRHPRHRFALVEEATMREVADDFRGVRVKPLHEVHRYGTWADIHSSRPSNVRPFERARAARRRFSRM